MKFTKKVRKLGCNYNTPTAEHTFLMLCLFPIFIFSRVPQNSDLCTFVFPSNFVLTIAGKALPDAFFKKNKSTFDINIKIRT